MAGGNFSGGDDELVSQINITPLVDVVLVLLVIFMMTAPVIYQSAIKVQLPSAKSGEKSQTQPLSFTLTSDGVLYFGKDKMEWTALSPMITAAAKKNPEEVVSVSADEKTPYGIVAKLMDALKEGGLSRIALNMSNKGK